MEISDLLEGVKEKPRQIQVYDVGDRIIIVDRCTQEVLHTQEVYSESVVKSDNSFLYRK